MTRLWILLPLILLTGCATLTPQPVEDNTPVYGKLFTYADYVSYKLGSAPEFDEAFPFMGFDLAHAHRKTGSGINIAVIDFFGGRSTWGPNHGWGVLEILLTAAPGVNYYLYDFDAIASEVLGQGRVDVVGETFSRVFHDADKLDLDMLSMSASRLQLESAGCAPGNTEFLTTANLIRKMINDKNMAVVVSAGNLGLGRVSQFPACVTGVTSAGAVYDVDKDEKVWEIQGQVICEDRPVRRGMPICWSSFGNLYAPGEEIVGFEDFEGDEFNGTSAAAPFLSAAFALLMADGYSYQDARFQLNRTSMRLQGVPVINIGKALGLDQPAPTPIPDPTHPAAFADTNDDGIINDAEARAAFAAWISGSTLNGVVVTDPLIRAVVNAWIIGERV